MQPGGSIFRYGLIIGLIAGVLIGFASRELLPSSSSDSPAKAPVKVAAYHASLLPGSYAADVLRVIDGDTLEARVHVWLDQSLTVRVRLRGVDAPELKGACALEKAMASSAHKALADFADGRQVVLSDVGPDKYFGRVVASLALSDGRQANAMLLERKLSRPYDGGHRAGWCEGIVPIARVE